MSLEMKDVDFASCSATSSNRSFPWPPRAASISSLAGAAVRRARRHAAARAGVLQSARQRAEVHARGRPRGLAVDERTTTTCEVRISDTGAGIDPDFLPHVFEALPPGGQHDQRRAATAASASGCRSPSSWSRRTRGRLRPRAPASATARRSSSRCRSRRSYQPGLRGHGVVHSRLLIVTASVVR